MGLLLQPLLVSNEPSRTTENSLPKTDIGPHDSGPRQECLEEEISQVAVSSGNTKSQRPKQNVFLPVQLSDKRDHQKRSCDGMDIAIEDIALHLPQSQSKQVCIETKHTVRDDVARHTADNSTCYGAHRSEQL